MLARIGSRRGCASANRVEGSCDVMRCDAVQCNVASCGAERCRAVWSGVDEARLSKRIGWPGPRCHLHLARIRESSPNASTRIRLSAYPPIGLSAYPPIRKGSHLTSARRHADMQTWRRAGAQMSRPEFARPRMPSATLKRHPRADADAIYELRG
jgi:hypothetical protein